MIVLEWYPNFSVFKIVRCFIIRNGEKSVKTSRKISKCARLVSHTSPFVCMLHISQIKMGIAAHFISMTLILKHFFHFKMGQSKKIAPFHFYHAMFENGSCHPGELA
jgi:hypothetical protein